MDIFKKITYDDYATLKEYITLRSHNVCDYSLGNLILWSDVYHTMYAIADEFLFIKFSYNEETHFAFPHGKGDLKKAFEWLEGYCSEQNIPMKLNVIDSTMFDEINAIYPDKYDITYSRDNADYIYNVSDLAELAGKKYHKKKNHVNRFIKENPDWSYERISDENTEETIKMVKEWCKANECCDDPDKAAEICVAIHGLMHRNELHMIGAILRVKDRIVAMTMGEPADDGKTFVIHFEKAFTDVNGAYPMINQQFILNELMSYSYVNREEDLGVEGLRKAKESYYPAFLAETGLLTEK